MVYAAGAAPHPAGISTGWVIAGIIMGATMGAGIGGFAGGARIGTWLCRSCINACYDLVRKRQIEAERVSPAIAPPNQVALRAQLEQALGRIHPRHRMVFLLFAVEGMKHAEIAAILEIPEGTSKDQIPAMLRELLATRFKLTTRREYREEPVYALVAAKGGLAVPPASQNADALDAGPNPATGEFSNMNGVQFYVTRLLDGGGSEVVMMNSPRMGTVRDSETGNPTYIRRFEAPSITLDGLADLLTIAAIGPEPVVNATGEQGRYQVTLEMSTAELEAVRRDPTHTWADLQSALLKAAGDGLKKLGLQLERRKAPVEVLVIDNLEKAPTDK